MAARAAADQRTLVQKKTFTKWFNSHLKNHPNKPDLIKDLYQDLRNGKKFFELLDVIKNEDDPKIIPPAKNPKMKLQCIENVNKILAFLKQKGVRLENIGGEDIHSGHPTLTLGLIWTIILRLQIGEIEGADAKNYKAALLAWCKLKTKGYKNVNVLDFKRSWMDGMAFNALIHAHRPNLIKMDDLRPADAIGNLRNAFSVAESIGIDSLLDPEDVVEYPDEKSIMTYLYAYYHFFTSMNAEELVGQRIARVLDFQMQIDEECAQYEADAKALLDWIEKKLVELKNLAFPNSFPEVRDLLDRFKSEYQHVEKPPHIMQKNDLESQLFRIQTLLRAGNRLAYHPTTTLQHVSDAWRSLELAETQYAQALRDALLRLERLDKLAKKFFTKAERRDEWLDETAELLAKSDFGTTLAEVNASRQREGAMVTEVRAYTERLELLFTMAATLVSENYSKKAEVAARETSIRTKWESTHESLDVRAKTLNEVLLMKRAEKDAANATEWITDMTATLNSQNVGANIDEVNNLIKAVKLEEAGKDGFKATTEAHMDGHIHAFITAKHSRLEDLHRLIRDVNQNFATLGAAFTTRMTRLDEALEFRRFEASLMEEDTWIQEAMRKATSPKMGSSTTATDRLVAAHQSLLNEITSHQKSAIDPLTATGQDLIAKGNPDKAAIKSYVGWLSKQWASLIEHHRERNAALENALRFHRYAAEAGDITVLLTEREEYAMSEDFGKDTFASQSLLRSHDTRSHDLEAQKNKLEELSDQSKAIQSTSLITAELTTPLATPVKSAPPTPATTPGVSNLPLQVKARADFKARRERELTITKGEILTVVNSKDDKWWKVRRTSGDTAEGYVPASYVKRLKTSVATAPATPDAAAGPMRRLSTASRGESLEPTPDFAVEATSIQTSLHTHYDRVVALFDERATKLGEAIAYHDFCFEATELEIWIEERQRAAQDAEVGKEAEQVEMLTRKFDLFKEDIASNIGRVTKFNGLANKLAQAGHSDSVRIRERQKIVNAKWQALQDVLAAHTGDLVTSGDVALFTHSVEETSDWITSKLATMSDDLGRDVASVTYLQRLHTTFTSDFPAIEERLKAIEVRQQHLQEQYADRSNDVATQLDRPKELWATLSQRAADRQKKLDEALAFQKFLNDYRDQKLWCSFMQSKIDSVSVPADEPTADSAVKLIESYRGEMMHPALVSWRDSFVKTSEALSGNSHFAAAEIAEKCREVTDVVAAVETSLGEHWGLMSKFLELRAWERDHAILKSWLERQEAFLLKDDLGDSLDSVEALQKRHGEFAAGLDAHGPKIEAYAANGKEVAAYGLDECGSVLQHQEALTTQYATVIAQSDERAAKLCASEELQQFHRQCANALVWIDEQLVTALEPSYNDAKLLKSSAQRHETFESSLADFKSEVKAIDTAATTFVEGQHYARDVIGERNSDVQTAWLKLCEESAKKAQKLKEALQENDFKHLIADLFLFCDDIQKYLTQVDVGKDVTSAEELLDRCRRREDDVVSKKEAVNSITIIADDLVKAGHFRSDDIAQNRQDIVDKFSALNAPLAARHATLEASLRWHQFQRSMAEANAWIDEKMLTASSEEYVEDLDSCGRMANEFRVVADQIVAQWDTFESLQLATAAALLADKHGESERISAMRDALTARYQNLKETSSSRLTFLDDMRKTSQFLVDSSDSLDWIEEQGRSIVAQDVGADAASTDSARTSHVDATSNIEGHGLIVDQLVARGSALVDSRHAKCPVPPVTGRSTLLKTAYANLLEVVEERASALAARTQWHQYDASVNESIVWISGRTEVASSDNIGKDRQDCEALLKQFNDFCHDVDAARGKRLDELSVLGQEFAASDHEKSESITTRRSELEAAWESMMMKIDARNALLTNAHKIHSFYESCETATSRIGDKTVVASRTDYGDELAAAESLTAEHKVFEIDLEAVQKQVSDLVSTCNELKEKFHSKADDLTEKLSIVTSGWENLKSLTKARHQALDQSVNLQSFLVSLTRVVEWMADVGRVAKETVAPSELDQAETLLQEHGKLKAEIDARGTDIEAVVADGERIAQEFPALADTVTEKLDSLQGKEMLMVRLWEDCDRLLQESYESLMYARDSNLLLALLDSARERLDALVPGQDSTAEIADRMEAVASLMATIDANAERFNKLQDLTEAERLELESSGGTESVAEYERTVEAARLQRVKDAELTAAKQQQAEEARKEALAEVEEEHRAEEAERAHRRAKEIAARAEKRRTEQEVRRKAAADSAARISQETEKRRSLASVSAQEADERRSTLRHASDARVARAAAKMAAAKEKARLQKLKASGTSEA